MLSLAGTTVRTPSSLRVVFSNIAKIEQNAAGPDCDGQTGPQTAA